MDTTPYFAEAPVTPDEPGVAAAAFGETPAKDTDWAAAAAQGLAGPVEVRPKRRPRLCCGSAAWRRYSSPAIAATAHPDCPLAGLLTGELATSPGYDARQRASLTSVVDLTKLPAAPSEAPERRAPKRRVGLQCEDVLMAHVRGRRGSSSFGQPRADPRG